MGVQQYYTQPMRTSSHSSSHGFSRRPRLRLVRSPKTLFVIPAFNEEASIGRLLDRMAALGLGPVLVISDCSRDDTVAVARRHGAQVLDLPLQLGAWGATQAGLRFAQRHGFDQVVTLDADGQHEPECIADLLAAQCNHQADIVIGTFPQRLSRARKLAWNWFRTLSGLRIEDLTSGFRLYDSRALRVLAAAEATLLDYQDVGVLLLARKYGLRIHETPVTMYPRIAGQSRVFSSWLTVAGYMVQTTVLCLARIGRFSAPERRAYENAA